VLPRCELVTDTGRLLRRILAGTWRRIGNLTAGFMEWLETHVLVLRHAWLTASFPAPIEARGSDCRALCANGRSSDSRDLVAPLEQPSVSITDNLEPYRPASKLHVLNLGHTILAETWLQPINGWRNENCRQ
jgi:tagaturonate reductase